VGAFYSKASWICSSVVSGSASRELETWVPNCTKCGLDVHWVAGLGVSPGHWAHREPAPHGEPTV
jgi:hypothetical protein